jgi:hypothetical protein
MMAGRTLDIPDAVNKSAIMKYGGKFLPGRKLKFIVAVNLAANYFKHHDEWPTKWKTVKGGKRKHIWDKSKRPSNTTVELSLKLGLSLDSLSKNMTILRGYLGMKKDTDLYVLAAPIKVWHADLVKLVRASKLQTKAPPIYFTAARAIPTVN